MRETTEGRQVGWGEERWRDNIVGGKRGERKMKVEKGRKDGWDVREQERR